MDEQSSPGYNLALPRIHWTARVSCGISVYTVLGFLVAIATLFSPPLRLSVMSPLGSFLSLPSHFLSFLLTPLHSLLSPLVLASLSSILFYLISFIFACVALRISGKQAWRKGRRLAMISVILSGIMLVQEGLVIGSLILFLRLNFHTSF